ncbi:DUF3987 domain-containing protein [Aeromonas enteropelogenes]|uniref:DUF3987 domain-containing protein n=1 Tax=Aeromonas enteropelogenes TaxID=29489 RepID=UPI003BA10CA3
MMQHPPSPPQLHIISQMCSFLPLPLQHVVTELRQLTRAHDDIIINSMFNAMAVAVQASTDILHPFTHKPIPLSLYCITVAESGTRKSTVENLLMAPFRDFEQRQENDSKKRRKHYDDEIDIYNIRLKILKTNLKKAIANQNKEDETKAGAELKRHKENKPIAEPAPRILVSDITQSALQKALSASWNALCLNTDEAGKILNGKDFSVPSFYNVLWDATPFSIERIATGRSQVANYRFSMNLMLQPSVFAKYSRIHGEQARESGFFARCLFSFVQPSLTIQQPVVNAEPTPHLDKFIARITTLLDSAYEQFLCGQLHERRVLALRDTTQIAKLEHDKEVYRIQINTDDHPQAPQFIQRATEHTLRLAGVMHAFLAGNGNDAINDDLVFSAIQMMKEYSGRYQQAVDYHEITEALIQALLTFIQQHTHYHSSLNLYVTSKTLLLQKGPSKLRKKDQLDVALAILELRKDIQIKRAANGTYIIPYAIPGTALIPGMRQT